MDKKGGFIHFKKSKKQPFPIIISTQNLFCVIYIEKSWQSKSHRQRSKYPTFFYILLHYLLHQTPRPSALLPNNAFPFFADFSPPKTISIRREKRDRRHEVRRHLRHAIFSMDETFDAIILKARRERIHSGRLLHGTMAAVGFKTGGLGNEGGGTCRFSLLNAWELSRSARNSWKSWRRFVCARTGPPTRQLKAFSPRRMDYFPRNKSCW